MFTSRKTLTLQYNRFQLAEPVQFELVGLRVVVLLIFPAELYYYYLGSRKRATALPSHSRLSSFSAGAAIGHCQSNTKSLDAEVLS